MEVLALQAPARVVGQVAALVEILGAKAISTALYTIYIANGTTDVLQLTLRLPIRQGELVPIILQNAGDGDGACILTLLTKAHECVMVRW